MQINSTRQERGARLHTYLAFLDLRLIFLHYWVMLILLTISWALQYHIAIIDVKPYRGIEYLGHHEHDNLIKTKILTNKEADWETPHSTPKIIKPSLEGVLLTNCTYQSTQNFFLFFLIFKSKFYGIFIHDLFQSFFYQGKYLWTKFSYKIGCNLKLQLYSNYIFWKSNRWIICYLHS